MNQNTTFQAAVQDRLDRIELMWASPTGRHRAWLEKLMLCDGDYSEIVDVCEEAFQAGRTAAKNEVKI